MAVLPEEESPSEMERRRRSDYERQFQQSKKQIMKDMAASQKNMSMNQSRKSVKINNMDIDLDDLDMRKLTKEQKKDIREIERL